MIFVDASALIALIAGEPGADRLANALESDADRTISPIALWETVAGLCRSYRFIPARARAHVERFTETLAIRVTPIGQRELPLALRAWELFGKGRHPAALNLGDCFAYACAQASGATLLFVGDDFSRTDIRRA